MGFLRSSNFKQIHKISSSYSSPTTNSRFNYLIAINSPIQRLPLVFLTDPHRNIPKRWHGGHPHHHHHSGHEADYVFRLGFAADIALASGKALTGYLSGSTAIIADAVHSVSDVVLSGVALLSYRVARAPKDKEHPYGHS